jgi:hypothetical protein
VELLVRGKSWSVDEERLLRRLVEEGKSLAGIAAIMGKSREAVRQKKFNLGLCKPSEEQRTRLTEKRDPFSSSRLQPPSELPNVEESLKILASAMLKITEPGLSKEEVQRLHVAADLASKYKDAYAECMHYREIEQRLNEMEQEYEQSKNKKSEPRTKDLPPTPGQSSA